jgi:hypothetical protein
LPAGGTRRHGRAATIPLREGAATLDAPASDPPAAAALRARWLDLTRRVLPGMAAAEGWPIRLDHCFMRVCLDAAFGRPWHEAVRRPAVRHMTEAELARAVAVAERIAAVPSLLPGLNAESLRLRGKAGRRPGGR